MRKGHNGRRITPQTLCDQVLRIAEMLEPSWHALYALQMDQDVLGADESRWRLMDGAKAKPQIIGTASDEAIWYGFEMNKTAKTVGAVSAGRDEGVDARGPAGGGLVAGARHPLTTRCDVLGVSTSGCETNKTRRSRRMPAWWASRHRTADAVMSTD